MFRQNTERVPQTLKPARRDLSFLVRLSAVSTVMPPRIGEDFVGWKPPAGGDSMLGIVDFAIFPQRIISRFLAPVAED